MGEKACKSAINSFKLMKLKGNFVFTEFTKKNPSCFYWTGENHQISKERHIDRKNKSVSTFHQTGKKLDVYKFLTKFSTQEFNKCGKSILCLNSLIRLKKDVFILLLSIHLQQMLSLHGFSGAPQKNVLTS